MKIYRNHLKSSATLQTSYAAVRAGFVALALEKNRRATPFVEQARALKAAAAAAQTPADLLRMAHIRVALLTAAGVSDKAANHLEESDKTEAIAGLIRNFLEPAGANFVEELVFRFLLTRGDTLGGAMRNVGGFMAQCKLARCLISQLKIAGQPLQWLHGDTNQWTAVGEDDAGIELHLRGLCWTANGQARTLLFNLTVPLVKNNVDLILLACAPETLGKATYHDPAAYLVLGELKGGIDPAGADEHWKTARTALVRIQTAFAKHKVKPKIFFVGAAIEAKMAQEIWQMLQKGVLDNAANLTDEAQLCALTAWLCNL
jgi:hypothetical protein